MDRAGGEWERDSRTDIDQKVGVIERIAVIGKLCHKKTLMPSVTATMSAHKKTVVIRPQIHNDFLPTIVIAAFCYVEASVVIAGCAGELATEFGEP